MQRAPLLALLTVFALNAEGQTWCSPGATWTYGTDAFGIFGYQQYSYAGDTALGGLTGHRIAGQGAMSYFGQTQVDYWSNSLSFITGLQGDVVTLWSNTDQSWDTLFWMGAVPGDGWLRAPGLYGTCDPLDSVVVMDTSTVILDGMPLRRWEMAQVWSGGTTCSTVFTERLGWLLAFEPFPACLIVDGPTGLRCYSDEDISVSFFSFGCGSLVGTSETSTEEENLVYPNPGTDHFTIELPSYCQNATVILLDATGREVLHDVLRSDANSVRTSSLKPGLYSYLVFAKDGGKLGHGRWIKE